MTAGSQRTQRQSPHQPWLAHALGPVLITLLVAALAGLAIWTEQLRYRERAAIATQNITRLLEAHLGDTFDKIDVFLQLVAQQYVERVNGGLGEQIAANQFLSLQKIPLIDLDSVRITDAQGRVRFGAGAQRGTDVSVADQTFFQDAFNRPDAGLVVSGPVYSPGSGRPIMVFARALRDANGSFLGLVYANLSVAQFGPMFSGIELGAHGAAALRTDDLALVHRHPVSDESREAVGSAAVSPELRRAIQTAPIDGAYVARTSLDQMERSNVYRKVRNYPFYVIVGLATRDFLEGWRANMFLFLALAGVTVALTLLAGFTQYRWSRRQIEAIHNRFEAIVQTSSDAVVGQTVQGAVTSWNRGAEQMFGYQASEMIGRPMTSLFPVDRLDEEPRLLASVQLGERIAAFETVRVRSDGSLVEVSVALSPILDSRGAIAGVSSISRDITRHKAMEAEIRAMAFNDPLTRLPNRRLLMDRLRQAQLTSGRQRNYFAVLFIDLDKFKQVNDVHGHDVGDQLLIEVARRLQAAVRQHDTVARLGGDEFVILLEELGADEKSAADHVNTVADKILDAIEREYLLRRAQHRCSASIGIRLLVGNHDSVDQILMDADAAMYRVKHQRHALTPLVFE